MLDFVLVLEMIFHAVVKLILCLVSGVNKSASNSLRIDIACEMVKSFVAIGLQGTMIAFNNK